jgi:hypothetical protein
MQIVEHVPLEESLCNVRGVAAETRDYKTLAGLGRDQHKIEAIRRITSTRAVTSAGKEGA